MFVSDYISTNVFFSKWNFLHKFGEKLSWVKIIIWRKKPQMFQNIFPDFFPVCFQVPGILTVLYIVTHRVRSEPNACNTCEEILRIVLNLLWTYQHGCFALTIDIFCLLVYLSLINFCLCVCVLIIDLKIIGV